MKVYVLFENSSVDYGEEPKIVGIFSSYELLKDADHRLAALEIETTWISMDLDSFQTIEDMEERFESIYNY